MPKAVFQRRWQAPRDRRMDAQCEAQGRIWDLFLRCDFGLYFCCASFNLASAPASVTEFFGNQPRGSVS